MAKTLLTPDICIVGAGSSGLSLAAACAAFGVDVVLVEKGVMGGDCLNVGCVPSKSILAAAHHAHASSEATAFGVHLDPPRIDWRGVHDHVKGVIAGIAPMDSQERFEGLGVTVLRDEARFVDADTLSAGETTIRARRFVLATGSRPFVPDLSGLAAAGYETNETIFDRTTPPGRLVVIGGGPIGLELAQAHRRLGAEVTVLSSGRPLAKDDPELAGIVIEALRREGVVIHEGVRATRVETSDAGHRVHYGADGAEADAVEADTILVAAGRQAVTDTLDLDRAGIETTPHGIRVTKRMRTTNRRVYAIGDCADPTGRGGLFFTHVGNYHAGLVARALLFRLPASENRAIVPWATYTDPILAHVGLSEAEARRRHGAIRVLRSEFAENDRANTERRTEGMVKLIVTKRGRILGADIVGPGADEILNMWSLAVSKGLNIRDVAGMIAPYPTLAEATKRAATSFFVPTTKAPTVRRLVRLLQRFG